jgi:hypothetical protein
MQGRAVFVDFWRGFGASFLPPRRSVGQQSKAMTMKTRDFDMSPRREPEAKRRMKQRSGVPGFGLALLGGACVIGVFAVLAVLYNLG